MDHPRATHCSSGRTVTTDSIADTTGTIADIITGIITDEVTPT